MNVWPFKKGSQIDKNISAGVQQRQICTGMNTCYTSYCFPLWTLVWQAFWIPAHHKMTSVLMPTPKIWIFHIFENSLYNLQTQEVIHFLERPQMSNKSACFTHKTPHENFEVCQTEHFCFILPISIWIFPSLFLLCILLSWSPCCPLPLMTLLFILPTELSSLIALFVCLYLWFTESGS